MSGAWSGTSLLTLVCQQVPLWAGIMVSVFAANTFWLKTGLAAGMCNWCRPLCFGLGRTVPQNAFIQSNVSLE